MIYYAHRGNLNGSLPELENKPQCIDAAIAAGFSAEIDVRAIDGKFYLGHATASYPVPAGWIDTRKAHLLLHAKDTPTAQYLSALGCCWHYFCHSTDPFVITSKGLIWLQDSRLPVVRTAIVSAIFCNFSVERTMPACFGICSDFVQNARRQYENK